MSTRGDTGYPDAEDELWRAKAAANNPGRTGATQAAKELGPILSRAEALDALGLGATAVTPDGQRVCVTCGHPDKVMHAVAGDAVVLDGIHLVGCVRRHCGRCAGRDNRRRMA